MRFAALLMFITGPAFAGPMSSGTCQDIWDWAAAGVKGSVQGGAPALMAQDCIFRDIEIVPDSPEGVGAKVRAVSLSGPGLAAPVEGWLAFEALKISVDDLRLTASAPEARINWLPAAQGSAEGIDVEFSAVQDAAQDLWKINGLSADFPGDNALSLTLEAEGLELGSRAAAIGSLATARIHTADLTLDMDGMFESYLLVPLGAALLPDDDSPGLKITELKAKAQAVLTELPSASLDSASKAALSDLIDEWPNPKGILSLSLTSDAGFGAGNVLPLIMTREDDPAKVLTTLLAGIVIEITWQPKP